AMRIPGAFSVLSYTRFTKTARPGAKLDYLCVALPIQSRRAAWRAVHHALAILSLFMRSLLTVLIGLILCFNWAPSAWCQPAGILNNAGADNSAKSQEPSNKGATPATGELKPILAEPVDLPPSVRATIEYTTGYPNRPQGGITVPEALNEALI